MFSEQKVRFDEKIKQLRSSQGKNVKMFFDQEYHNFIQKHKDIKSPRYRMVPGDFYLLKRYEILQVEKNGTRLRYVMFFPQEMTQSG